ncbi:hypothetical protein LCL99_14610 [Halomonas denitrificans]|uniref:hypothetical protein n=1 Tax=Halomonas TaxID=2745 RepID=UPI001A8DA021|nr:MULTISPECIES: hypothetical protein [Halomonas]MEE3214364.1 hypothetical protein [Pseudomonadota bacterium]MBN8412589.1 hypothetical protein [Halomonas litopenaei]MBY5968824.1 hypothetical protein [Halomonas denitrificans]MBY5983798.1 hypothetical protein [Halomonas sp. DP5Y7-2]MBY6028622.1 hypothetical protein [Halomonas sp. DP8Y7-1]
MTTDQSRFTHEYQQNAAWRAASQWQQRARQARTAQRPSGLRLVLVSLIGMVTLVFATLMALTLSLVGLALMPFVRHRMKKRMETYRADHADDITPGMTSRAAHHDSARVWEGQCEVKSS